MRESINARVHNSIGRHDDLDMTSGRGSESRKKQRERDHRDNFDEFINDARDDVYRGLTSYRNRKRIVD